MVIRLSGHVPGYLADWVLGGLGSEGRSLQDGSFDALQKMTRVHSL